MRLLNCGNLSDVALEGTDFYSGPYWCMACRSDREVSGETAKDLLIHLIRHIELGHKVPWYFIKEVRETVLTEVDGRLHREYSL